MSAVDSSSHLRMLWAFGIGGNLKSFGAHGMLDLWIGRLKIQWF